MGQGWDSGALDHSAVAQHIACAELYKKAQLTQREARDSLGI